MSEEENSPPPVQAPPTFSAPPAPHPGAVDHVIPTSNPDALLAYYLGLFSIFPLLGLPMGAVAIAKGRKGLRRSQKEGLPGRTHAYVGLGCGSIGFLFNLAIVVLFALIILNSK